MKIFFAAAAIVVAAFVISPVTARAKGPGSGIGITFGSPGHGASWRWGGGHDWYPGWGYSSHNVYRYPVTPYVYPVTPYVVQKPILTNPLPEPVFSGGLIKIVNPATNTASLSYTLNGMPYTIQPGQSQEFREDRAWVIDFNRGAGFGQGRYGLHAGVYTFTASDRGWELYSSPAPASGASVMPADPAAPSLPPTP